MTLAHMNKSIVSPSTVPNLTNAQLATHFALTLIWLIILISTYERFKASENGWL